MFDFCLPHQRQDTRGDYDWTKRYPWIVEAALKNRHKQFVIDGEAVILGVDGYSDFNALHSGKHNEEVQLCAFDVPSRAISGSPPALAIIDTISAAASHAVDSRSASGRRAMKFLPPSLIHALAISRGSLVVSEHDRLDLSRVSIV
jgi:hypothetical protein